METKIKNGRPGEPNVKALLIGMVLIFILFVSYTNFNNSKETSMTSTKTDKSVIERIKELFKKEEKPQGTIDEIAAQDSRDEQVAGANDTKTEQWVATDYKKGDINAGTYKVKRGDTLWEIAEAVYGDGTQWHKILNANKDSVGYLPNGSQALIVTGQELVIP